MFNTNNNMATTVSAMAASNTNDQYNNTTTNDRATLQNAQHSHPGNLPASAGVLVDLFDYEAYDAAWRRVMQKRLQKRLARARNRTKAAMAGEGVRRD